jgi:hypothetical protein
MAVSAGGRREAQIEAAGGSDGSEGAAKAHRSRREGTTSMTYFSTIHPLRNRNLFQNGLDDNRNRPSRRKNQRHLTFQAIARRDKTFAVITDGAQLMSDIVNWRTARIPRNSRFFQRQVGIAVNMSPLSAEPTRQTLGTSICPFYDFQRLDI